MTPGTRSAAHLAVTVTRLAEPARLGPRLVHVRAPHPFDLDVRNDFFTGDGDLYKWQEFTAQVDRTVAGGVAPPLVPVRYTWRSVRSRTGPAGSNAPPREWTFARGQGFTSALLDSDVYGGPAPKRVAQSPTSLGVTYPGLPKTPAVDALVTLSWDVLLFEILCTELTTHPGLLRTGTTAQLTRLSDRLTSLQLAGGRSDVVFQHHQLNACRQGYGMQGGRPVAIFSFECLDCEVSSRTGGLRQRLRSTYLGSLRVDLETGDLIGANMVEMMVGLSTVVCRTIPVRKRRVLRLAVPERHPGEVTVDADSPPVTTVDHRLLADAAAAAQRLADHLRQHLGWLAGVPDQLLSLAELTFRSVTGTDLRAAPDAIDTLRDRLRAWDGGPRGPLADMLQTGRQELDRLETYCRLGTEMAGKVSKLAGVAAADTVTDHLDAVRRDVAELSATLARLDHATNELDHATNESAR